MTSSRTCKQKNLSWKLELLKYLMCSSTTQYIVDTGAMSSLEQRNNSFFQRNNSTLSLVVLTWLWQLQQFFLNEEKKDKIGDWNNFGKYTGTTANNLKDTTPLPNINFSSASTPKVLTQIPATATSSQRAPRELPESSNLQALVKYVSW